MGKILFDKLGFPKGRGKISTAHDVLIKYKSKIVELINKYFGG